MKRIILFAALLMPLFASGQAAERYYKDADGIIRSAADGSEAAFFGCNYTLPFAHAFRAATTLGADLEKAIDNDVYHLARLGFNAYRIHVWDTEISDREGGLLHNDHLRLLDYLIGRLEERGFTILLTLQTNGSNGYPDPPTPTEGFSEGRHKCEAHSDPEIIAKQEHYLYELVSHTNPYTGKSYAEDPAILGFEINNEPCHTGAVDQVRGYIDRMAAAVRRAGSDKLIYYNVSHNLHVAEAYFTSSIDGCTFQWYPTGLVANRTRRGNFLPNVDRYNIPFRGMGNYDSLTKAVYEFDAADVAGSYIYPAMVRTFKSAGMQWITQFAYDPTVIADVNTEYQTHYLNLAYTPSKAISMRIAAEAARRIPAYEKFPSYPADTVFGNFRVSYREDLSEYVTDEVFLYSNTTASVPVNPAMLREVAGCGNSPVVEYGGTGAYFLDKLENGVWRLEVMPDAVWIRDPFERASPKKKVARIIWNSWDMTIRLPDLGSGFSVNGISEGNNLRAASSDRTFRVTPGTYILAAKGNKNKKWAAESRVRNFLAGEFYAPPTTGDELSFIHEPPVLAVEGSPLKITVTVASAMLPERVELIPAGNRRMPPIPVRRIHGYTYEGEIPAEYVREGRLDYYISVRHKGGDCTFPSGVAGKPSDWDFYTATPYSVEVIAKSAPVVLCNAGKSSPDTDLNVVGSGKLRIHMAAGSIPSVKAVSVTADGLNGGSTVIARVYVGDIIRAVGNDAGYGKLVINGLSADNCTVSTGFLTADGLTYKSGYTGIAHGEIDTRGGLLEIPLAGLIHTDTFLLPEVYPEFMLRTFMSDARSGFDLRDVEFLEITLRPASAATELSFSFESVWLE